MNFSDLNTSRFLWEKLEKWSNPHHAPFTPTFSDCNYSTAHDTDNSSCSRCCSIKQQFVI